MVAPGDSGLGAVGMSGRGARSADRAARIIEAQERPPSSWIAVSGRWRAAACVLSLPMSRWRSSASRGCRSGRGTVIMTAHEKAAAG